MSVEQNENRTYTIKLDLDVKGGKNTEFETPQDKQDGENQHDQDMPGIKKAKTVSKGAIAASLAKSQGTKIVNGLIGSFGDMTGEYVAQANMQAVANIVSTGFGIAAATAAGGVAGLVVSVIGTGVSAGLNAYNYAKNINMSNKEAAWKAQRVGYSSFR